MHEIQIFTPVSPERWQRLKAALAAKAGLTIADDKGTVQGHGITLSYCYDLGAATLTLQTLDKPFYLAESVVDQKIHDFVEECG